MFKKIACVTLLLVYISTPTHAQTPDYTKFAPAYQYKDPDENPYKFEENIENPRFQDFINKAVVRCIDNPTFARTVLDETKPETILSWGSKTHSAESFIDINQIANIAHNQEKVIEAFEDPAYNPAEVLAFMRSTSLFTYYDPSAYYAICRDLGGQSIEECADVLDAKVPGTSSTNTFLIQNPETTSFDLRSQFQRQVGTCMQAFQCQADPGEGIPCWTLGADNEICTEIVEMEYEDFLSASPKTKLDIMAIRPNLADFNFYIVAAGRQPGVGDVGNQFLRLVTVPDTTVVKGVIHGLQALKVRAFENIRRDLAYTQGGESHSEDIIADIDFATYNPLTLNPSSLESPSGPAITQLPLENSLGETEEIALARKAVIAKVNQAGDSCSIIENPIQFAGAQTDSNVDTVSISASIQSAISSFTEWRQVINESINPSRAWIVYPAELEMLGLALGRHEQGATVRQHYEQRFSSALDEPVDAPGINASTQGFDPTYQDVEEEEVIEEESISVVSRLIARAKATYQAQSSKNTTIAGAEHVLRRTFEIGKNILQPLDSYYYFTDTCYVNNICARQADLCELFEISFTNSSDCAEPITLADQTNTACIARPSEAREDRSACTDYNTATTQLGFNVGEGSKVINGWRDSGGKPVTFLVPLTASNEELEDWANEYKSASMRIIRITGFDGNTDPRIFSAAGSRFSAYFSGPNDVVVLGNELNNLDAEYPGCGSLSNCGTTYVSQFDAFNSNYSGNLAAAPLDTSNSVYDAAEFLATAILAYQNSSYIATNSYEGAGGCGLRCSRDSWQWLLEASGTVGKPVILTEYNLAPGKDGDLDEVAEFITNNLPSTYKGSTVVAITPLVDNVCGYGWLRFHCNTGEFVDPQGRAVYKVGQ